MDEELLIKKCKAADPEAWELLVQLHRGPIFAHCLGITHDAKAAEDLAQETFVHAFQHIAEFRGSAALGTWLWRIAHNLSLNYVKKHPHNESQFNEELLPPAASEDPAPPEGVDLTPYLAQLPEKQRAVLHLYLVERLSQKEIAHRLQLPQGTVRSRLHYAKKRLRGLLVGRESFDIPGPHKSTCGGF